MTETSSAAGLPRPAWNKGKNHRPEAATTPQSRLGDPCQVGSGEAHA